MPEPNIAHFERCKTEAGVLIQMVQASQRAIGILATLSAIVLLQPGCATRQTGDEAKQAPIVVKELVKSTRSWDGALLVSYPQGQPEVIIRQITIPAGARLETHRHPVINAGVLTRGELTVVAEDGKTLHLKAGDPIVELVNKLHYGVNEGKVPAEIIVIYAGTLGTPVTLVKQE